jgi:hypothetical protein
MISSAMREPIENGLDMAKATAFKAASVGAIGATAQFLTEPKIKLKKLHMDLVLVWVFI